MKQAVLSDDGRLVACGLEQEDHISVTKAALVSL
jgi:hypothetical protein